MFLWRARRRRIDTVINMEAFVRYSSMLSYLSGACRRVGFHRFNQEGLYTGDLLTHKVLHNGHIHAAHTFLDLVHALDAPPDQVPRVKRPRAMDRLEVPKISTDASAAAGIWRKLRAINADIGPTRKLVVLNPNASDKFPMRRLPLESFTELARRLLEDPEVFVLITGVASEKPDAQYMCARLGSPRALDLTGQTTMTELLHLFDLAHVLVTNDSGPAHFAALTRIHEVVFFGPEIPDRYRPLTTNSDVIHTGYSCSPCIGPLNQRRSPCNDNLCLKSISIEEIAALVRSRLEAVRSAASGSTSRPAGPEGRQTMKPIMLRLVLGLLVSFGCRTIPGQDVRYEPTPMPVVRALLKLADVGPQDLVYDLGSGDGRIPITAANEFGARGVGIEIDPALVTQAQARRARQVSRTKWSSGSATCMPRTSGPRPS